MSQPKGSVDDYYANLGAPEAQSSSPSAKKPTKLKIKAKKVVKKVQEPEPPTQTEVQAAPEQEKTAPKKAKDDSQQNLIVFHERTKKTKAPEKKQAPKTNKPSSPSSAKNGKATTFKRKTKKERPASSPENPFGARTKRFKNSKK